MQKLFIWSLMGEATNLLMLLHAFEGLRKVKYEVRSFLSDDLEENGEHVINCIKTIDENE